MLLGGASIGTTPFSTPSLPFSGVDSPFYTILRKGTSQDVVLLLEATVYDPVADADVNFRGLWSNARRPWRGVGDDTGPHPETMLQPSLGSALLFGGAPLSGESQDSSLRFGNFVLAINHQKGWEWTRYDWPGSPFVIKAGGPDAAYSDFEEIARGELSDAKWDRGQLTLLVADTDDAIRQPIQTEVYGGTGGLDGTAELENQRKPLCYGQVYNRLPKLIDPDNNVYQIHDGEVESIEVYDGGIVFDTSGPTDVPDVYAWTPVAGEWVTDLAHGVFRLGNRPAFTLTFDAEGDADSSLSGYVDMLAAVVERIMVQRSSLTASQLDGLLPLSLAVPYRVGFYTQDGSGSIDDALRALLSPLGCFRLPRPNGLLFFGQLALGGVSRAIAEHHFAPGGLRRIRTIRAIESHRMLYRQVEVQKDDELADAVDASRAAFVSNEWREVIYENATSRRRARTIETQTALLDSTAATLEASRQALQADALPGIFEATLNFCPFDVLAGSTVSVTHSELGFEDGVECVVVGIAPNIPANSMVLTLWA